MTRHADEIIPLYERSARQWDRDRSRSGLEFPWLDRFVSLMGNERQVLDLGCGTGEPIAGYLVGQGCQLTGIDAAPSMIDISRTRFPTQSWLACDMRTLALPKKFNGIIAWNSFFHLTHDDQRRMFPVFRRHALKGTALMFTSGTELGISIGEYRNSPLFHASLDTAEYNALLDDHGFEPVVHVADDKTCGGLTIWLARYR